MKQGVDSDFGCDSDVADVRPALVGPLGDVEEPLRGREVLEHVAELEGREFLLDHS